MHRLQAETTLGSVLYMHACHGVKTRPGRHRHVMIVCSVLFVNDYVESL